MKIDFFLPQVFKGYVDDPRNTDNAWMETVAVNFHDESGTHLKFKSVFIFTLVLKSFYTAVLYTPSQKQACFVGH